MMRRRHLALWSISLLPVLACSSSNSGSESDAATDSSLGSSTATAGTADESGTTSGAETGDTGDTAGESADDTEGETGIPGCSLGPWLGNTVDERPPSDQPPCGLTPSEVPMFVVLGWDDNAAADGMTWSVEAAAARTNPDGSPVRFTYYNTSTYTAAAGTSWKAAYDAGHEMGNHTINHDTSNNTDATTWNAEMQGCHDAQVGLGIGGDDIIGFRAPFLSTNDDTIGQVQAMGYWYDCSLEEGYQLDQDGTNFLWPYTLENGSPGNDLVADEWMSASKGTVGSHPGLWEMPSYALMVPDDEACVELGIAPGLQQRVQDGIMASEGWSWSPPKITGFDYNLWYSGQVSAEEFTAILEHTLNLRLAGNRAPLLIGTHTSYYVPSWDTNSPNADNAARRAAVEAFLDEALSRPDVRVVTAREVLEWVRNPVPL